MEDRNLPNTLLFDLNPMVSFGISRETFDEAVAFQVLEANAPTAVRSALLPAVGDPAAGSSPLTGKGGSIAGQDTWTVLGSGTSNADRTLDTSCPAWPDFTPSDGGWTIFPSDLNLNAPHAAKGTDPAGSGLSAGGGAQAGTAGPGQVGGHVLGTAGTNGTEANSSPGAGALSSGQVVPNSSRIARPAAAAAGTLGHFSLLTGPYNMSALRPVGASGSQVYFSDGATGFYRYNDATRVWSRWTLPYSAVKSVCVLPNGTIEIGNGQGNTSTTAGMCVNLNPTTGKVTVSNLNANFGVSGLQVDKAGEVVAVTEWSGWLTGQTWNKQQQAVWASTDGITFHLRGAIGTGYGTFYLSHAVDGSGRLWMGGEDPNSVWESSDNGSTWHNVGTQNSKGFSYDQWGMLQLSDGTLLVAKTYLQSGVKYPIVRGLAGGSWTPSSTGLRGASIARNLLQCSDGIVLCGEDTYGVFASYDSGKSWTSLVSDGVPAGNNFVQVTTHNVYVHVVGYSGVYVAPVF
jgi:hypothetical protein